MSKQLVYDTAVTDDDRDVVGAVLRSGTTELTNTGGALDVNIASADINFNESDIYAEDSAHTTADQGSFVLAVRQDTLAASVDTDGDYGAFKIDSVGSLYTRDTNAAAILTTIDTDTGVIAGDTTSIDATLTALSKAEDSAHSSGDQGIQMLAVRQDTLASSVSADGDYGSLKMNSDGALYVDIGSATDPSLANTAFAHGATSVDTTAGGTDLVGTALSNRLYLHLANEGTRKAYIGTLTSVTPANGFPIAPGEKMMFRAGASLDPAAITSAGTADMRYFELS